MKLLHLDASIQGENSASRLLSAAVVERLAALDPTVQVARRDLAADALPHITLPALAGEQGTALQDEFLAADIIVIGAPMYNFGIPTQLKSWFDHVLVAGKTFRYGPEGAEGLVGAKRVIVVHSRGGLYGADSANAANEHAESHLRAMLGFVGITDPIFVVAEGVAYGPEQRQAALDAALAAIASIGSDAVLAAAA